MQTLTRGLGQDIRLALRQIVRRPVWSSAIVLVLALGIAANTSMFAGFDAWVTRELDFKQPSQLVTVDEVQPKLGISGGARIQSLGHWRRSQTVFSEMGAFDRQVFNFDDQVTPTRVQGARITADLFPMLGKAPVLGRTFGAEDDLPSAAAAVALIGDRLWRERFAAAPSAVGETVRIDGREHQIVGVMEAGFEFPEYGQVWVPMGADPDKDGASERWTTVVARVRPEIGQAGAQGEMERIGKDLAQRYGRSEDWSVTLKPLRDEWVPGVIEVALSASLGAAILVLLIICANVASLMIVQSEGRSRETAVRAALGGSRWRQVRQTLVESTLLALLAGVLGVWLSQLWVDAMIGRVPVDPPYLFAMRFDPRTAAYTLLISILAGLACAVAPMLRTRRQSSDALRSGDRFSSKRAGRMRGMLIVGELTLSTALVVCALLLVKSFVLQQQVSRGYRTDGLLTADISLTGPELEAPKARVAFLEQLQAKLDQLPGVQLATTTTSLPASGRIAVGRFQAEGVITDEREGGIRSSVHGVGASYFETLEIPLLQGRSFRHAEVRDGSDVVIVSESLASLLWPDESALGRKIRSTSAQSTGLQSTTSLGAPPWLQVVGVALDVDPARDMVNRDRPGRQIYRPYGALPFPRVSVALRTQALPESLAPQLREAVWSAGNRVPISEILTLEQSILRTQWVTRFFSEQLALYGAIALVIAAFGIYGLVADSVARRVPEIALRVALGASRRDLVRLLLGSGIRMIVLGIGLGLGLAVFVSRFGSSMLLSVGTTDPAIYGGVALLLAAAALAASYLPARKGLDIEPAEALRAE